MSDRLFAADCCDMVAGALIYAAEISDVLNWVYMGLLILSLALGIGLKIWAALKDGKPTDGEIEDLRRELEKAAEKAKEAAERSEKKEAAEAAEKAQIRAKGDKPDK